MDVATYIKTYYPDVPPLKFIPERITRFDIGSNDKCSGWAVVFHNGEGFVGNCKTDEIVRCIPPKKIEQKKHGNSLSLCTLAKFVNNKDKRDKSRI